MPNAVANVKPKSTK
jgi:hypothetical protein